MSRMRVQRAEATGPPLVNPFVDAAGTGSLGNGSVSSHEQSDERRT